MINRYVGVGSADSGSSLGESGDDYKTIASYMNDFLDKYKVIVVGVYAIVFLTLVLVLIIKCTKLSTVSGNPMNRKKTVSEIIICLIAIAFLGSIGLISALTYNMFR